MAYCFGIKNATHSLELPNEGEIGTHTLTKITQRSEIKKEQRRSRVLTGGEIVFYTRVKSFSTPV